VIGAALTVATLLLFQGSPKEPPPPMSAGCDKVCQYAKDQCDEMCKEKQTNSDAMGRCHKACKEIHKPCMEQCEQRKSKRKGGGPGQ
jgi:hypothetical protein